MPSVGIALFSPLDGHRVFHVCLPFRFVWWLVVQKVEFTTFHFEFILLDILSVYFLFEKWLKV